MRGGGREGGGRRRGRENEEGGRGREGGRREGGGIGVREEGGRGDRGEGRGREGEGRGRGGGGGRIGRRRVRRRERVGGGKEERGVDGGTTSHGVTTWYSISQLFFHCQASLPSFTINRQVCTSHLISLPANASSIN